MRLSRAVVARGRAQTSHTHTIRKANCSMDFNLVVVHAFASYARGDVITDPAVVSKILASNPRMVTKVAAPHPHAAQSQNAG